MLSFECGYLADNVIITSDYDANFGSSGWLL